jgi:hypothetical protein
LHINATLPISLKVLSKKPFNRYELLLGKREISTKSQRELKVGYYYWGELHSAKGGIMQLSNLIQKPEVLQKESVFDIDFESFLKLVKSNSLREFLVKKIKDSKSKDEFELYANSLLALSNGIFSYIFKKNGYTSMIELRGLNKAFEGYIADSNFGPISFFADFNKGAFYVKCAYERVAFVFKESLSDFIDDIIIDKNIKPMFIRPKSEFNLKI